MTRYVVQRLLTQSFRRYGRFLAHHPIWFLVFPIVLTAILATGIVRARSLRDVESLMVPFNSRSIRDRNIVENLFPMNTSKDFDITRLTKLGRYASAIVLAKDGGGILRKDIFRDIIAIDRIIKNISVRRSNVTWDYSQLCCKRYERCADTNVVLKLESKLDDFRKGLFKFRHPFDLDPLTYKIELYGLNLGGITKDSDGYVTDAKAFRLMYYLNDENKMVESILWEKEFEKTVGNIEFSTISIAYVTASTNENELKTFTDQLFPLGIIAFVTILLFSVIAFLTTNWVSSKPCLGLAACVGVLLSITSAFGLVMHCGVEYIDVNAALVFIMLGIGIDDSFILLSAWRRTNSSQNFVQRMENAYSEAAVSITITSLTDLLAFLVCIFNPFPVVRIFCVYASASIFFTYIYQITFFGACMALSGEREPQKADPLTVCHLPTLRDTDQEENTSRTYVNSERTLIPVLGKLRDLHRSRATQYIAMALSVGLLAVGIYGLTNLEEGLEPKDIFPHDSSAFRFTELFYKYYTDYAHRIHIIINQPLNYADRSVQNQIENIISRFEEKVFICKSWCTESWLKFYLNFSTTEIAKFSLQGYDLTQEQDFVDGLRNVFMRFIQTTLMNQDIVYDQNFTKITAARFFVNTLDVSNKASEKEMLKTIWDITDASSLPITTFALWFPMYEQLLFIKPLAIQSLATAGLLIFVIFVIFVPNMLSAISVSLVTIFIQIEVIGLMTLWDIKMDIVTLLSLIMCVGFSLNYPAHFCFAFATSTALGVYDRIKYAMDAVGIPVLQGSITTLLGVAVLGFQNRYIMILFFKIVSIIVLLVVVHSLFILPAVLALTAQFPFTYKICHDDNNRWKTQAIPKNSAL